MSDVKLSRGSVLVGARPDVVVLIRRLLPHAWVKRSFTLEETMALVVI